MDNLWLLKYKPKTCNDIIGHGDTIKNIKNWLYSFNDANSASSIIISGNHGIGKTITINLILNELNYNIINISTYNIKENKTIKNILTNNNINNYSSDNSINSRAYAVIVDDTENITLNSEKNFLFELFKDNEKNKYLPLIFLTNEQHSKLISDIKKTCKEIKIKLPTLDEYKKFINMICTKENINIKDEKIYEDIIKICYFDIRKIIFTLQDLKFSFNENEITSSKIHLFLESSKRKDKDLGLFDATKKLLGGFKSIDKCYSLYDTEKVLLPLMIFENYPRNLMNRDFKNPQELYNNLVNISDSISMGDIIETNIYSDQNWFLQSLHGFYTCCKPIYELNKNKLRNKNYEIIFTSDLNKTSIKNINKKNIYTIQEIIKRNINDILIFSNLIMKLLKKENYKKIKKIFKSYKIDNKYLEIILKIDKTLDKILLSQKIKKIILKNLN
jgi:replication factor C subunit 1